MSWSLEVFSPQTQHVSIEELEARLREVAVRDPLHFGVSPEGGDLRVVFHVEETPGDENGAATWVLRRVGGDKTSPMAFIQMQPFSDETATDPQLLGTLKHEIDAVDAEDGELDNDYSSRLQTELESSKWHYVVWVAKNGKPEQERLVVQTAYVLSQIGKGIIHDLQSGAWMDADLFESLLDAYGAVDSTVS